MRLEVLERAPREMPDDLELHQRDRTPSMWTSSEAIGKPDHALELVLDTRADRLRDLGELEAVLDDDAELDDEPVGDACRRRRLS